MCISSRHARPYIVTSMPPAPAAINFNCANIKGSIFVRPNNTFSMRFMTAFMGYDDAQLDMENILQTMDAKEKLEKGINVMRKLLRLHLKDDASQIGNDNSRKSTSSGSSKNSQRRLSLMTSQMIERSDVVNNKINEIDSNTDNSKDEKLEAYAKSLKYSLPKSGKNKSPRRKFKAGRKLNTSRRTALT